MTFQVIGGKNIHRNTDISEKRYKKLIEKLIKLIVKEVDKTGCVREGELGAWGAGAWRTLFKTFAFLKFINK